MRTWIQTRILINGLGAGTIRERSDRVDDLQRIGRKAVAPLLLVLSDHEPDEMMDAMRALARIGDPRAVSAVAEMLDHENERVREHAAWALRVLRSSDQGKTKKELMEELKSLRGRVTQAVREREQLARSMLEACPDIALLVDADARVLAANTPAADSLNVELAKLIGSCAYDAIRPEAVDEHRQALERVVRTGRSLVFEDSRDGHWFENYFEPVPGENGVVSRVAIFARDITDRKADERELVRLRSALDRQVRQVPFPVYAWHRSEAGWVLDDFNEAAHAITGGRIAEFRGMALDHVHANRPDIRDEIERCAAEDRALRGTMRYRFHSTGTERVLDVHYVPLPPDRVMVVTYDLTDFVQPRPA